MSDILKILKSLVSDIEAMQSPGPHDSYWFGEFSTYQEDRLNDTVAVMWPNLAISLEEAKKVIAEAEKPKNKTNAAQPAWPGKGDKMRFLDENGYDHDRELARKHFTKGQIVTVKAINIGSFNHSIQFEESGEVWLNGVMFEWIAHQPT